MTVTSPAPARARRVLAALAATLVLCVAGPAAHAAEVAAVPALLPLDVTVSAAGDGVVTPGEDLTVTVAAVNPSDAAVEAGAVRLTTSTTPLDSRDAVTGWLAETDEGAVATAVELATAELPGIAAHSRDAVTTEIDADDLDGLSPGVYPLRADYDSDQGRISTVSVFTVADGEAGGALSVIVPLTATPSGEGLLTADELATLTAADGLLRGQLDAVTGTEAVLAVDPAIVAAIRALGTTAPASATAWLDDLLALPNERFAMQFGDADLATQVAAGLDAPLDVETLEPYVVAEGTGEPVDPTPTPPPSPSRTPPATPDPDASGEPAGEPAASDDERSLAALTDIGPSMPGVFWPASGTAGDEVVTALGALTPRGRPSLTLVSSDTLASQRPVPAWARAGDARVVVYDADASAAYGRAAGKDDPVDRSRDLAAAAAYAALASAADPDAPLVVAVDRSVARSATALRATLTAASGLAGREAGRLSEVTTGTPTRIALDSVNAGKERVAGLQSLLADEEELTSFATILEDPAVLLAPERAEILHLISAGWRALPRLAADALADHRDATVETLASVAVVPPDPITLAAASGPLTFSIRNELAWPVSLVLVATPNDPRLIVPTKTPVEAGPAQNTRVQVPVEARVGSGESTLDLQLRSPSMVAIGDPVPVEVSVRAEWESFGLIVMIVLVSVMIVLGVVRTVRRMRRGREETGG